MGIGTCAINGLYTIICRNPDTAAGGLDPGDTVNHADGFYRVGRRNLDDMQGTECDRKVEVVYVGTADWVGPLATYNAPRTRRFEVTVRIGYFAGDHDMETQMAAADDDHQICKALMLQSNWPTGCTGGGCVEAYIPEGSSFQQMNEEQWVLEITVSIQVTA